MEPYFLGNAQVRIESMSFEPGIRDFDNANVARLLKIFRLEGCHRSDPSHFIPALVTKDILGPGWQQGLQPQLLSLPVSVNLRCLHGKHRILAAKQYFPYIEQWWNVALYESGEYDSHRDPSWTLTSIASTAQCSLHPVDSAIQE